jgi:hypothetical protein
MLARAGHEPRPYMPVGRPAQTSTNIVRLGTRHNKHWPVRSPTQRRCRVCSARGVTLSVKFKCLKCDMALCVEKKLFYRLPHKRQFMTHLFVLPPCKELKPGPQRE